MAEMILKKLFESTKQEVTAQQAAKLISTKGVNFLKESNGRVPYSGRRNVTVDAFVGQYRVDRRPLDSTDRFQRTVDQYLSEHGVKSLRSNSIFLTLKYESASGYGKPMLIFPLGTYNYHWYYDIGDLTILYKHSYLGDEDHDSDELSSMTGIDEDRLKEFMRITLDSEYATLSDLVDHDLLTLEQYEAIVTYEEMTRVDLKVNSDLDDWIDVNDNRGHHELILNSSDGYLAIDPEYFVEEVLPLLPDGLIDTDALNVEEF